MEIPPAIPERQRCYSCCKCFGVLLIFGYAVTIFFQIYVVLFNMGIAFETYNRKCNSSGKEILNLRVYGPYGPLASGKISSPTFSCEVSNVPDDFNTTDTAHQNSRFEIELDPNDSSLPSMNISSLNPDIKKYENRSFYGVKYDAGNNDDGAITHFVKNEGINANKDNTENRDIIGNEAGVGNEADVESEYNAKNKYAKNEDDAENEDYFENEHDAQKEDDAENEDYFENEHDAEQEDDAEKEDGAENENERGNGNILSSSPMPSKIGNSTLTPSNPDLDPSVDDGVLHMCPSLENLAYIYVFTDSHKRTKVICCKATFDNSLSTPLPKTIKNDTLYHKEMSQSVKDNSSSEGHQSTVKSNQSGLKLLSVDVDHGGTQDFNSAVITDQPGSSEKQYSQHRPDVARDVIKDDGPQSRRPLWKTADLSETQDDVPDQLLYDSGLIPKHTKGCRSHIYDNIYFPLAFYSEVAAMIGTVLCAVIVGFVCFGGFDWPCLLAMSTVVTAITGLLSSQAWIEATRHEIEDTWQYIAYLACYFYVLLASFPGLVCSLHRRTASLARRSFVSVVGTPCQSDVEQPPATPRRSPGDLERSLFDDSPQPGLFSNVVSLCSNRAYEEARRVLIEEHNSLVSANDEKTPLLSGLQDTTTSNLEQADNTTPSSTVTKDPASPFQNLSFVTPTIENQNPMTPLTRTTPLTVNQDAKTPLLVNLDQTSLLIENLSPVTPLIENKDLKLSRFTTAHQTHTAPSIDSLQGPTTPLIGQNGKTTLSNKDANPATPMVVSPFPKTPLVQSPFPTAPLPESPFPTAPLPESPFPTTPLLENPYPTTPSLESPYPTTPLLESPYPMTPLLESPYPTTPLLESPYPTTPLTESPYPTTPLIESPYPTTPLVETPHPATPLLEKSFPTTPLTENEGRYPTTPSVESPYPTTPSINSPYPTTPLTGSSVDSHALIKAQDATPSLTGNQAHSTPLAESLKGTPSLSEAQNASASLDSKAATPSYQQK